MEIFIDTANEKEIKKWMDACVVDGVTTNPSIMLKDGAYDVEAKAKEIAKLIHPRPLSVEVDTNDHQEMLVQARKFVKWANNIVVKIPVINEMGEPSMSVIHTLRRENINVNVTACLSFGQACLSAKAGATYISLFGGRIGDEGQDPVPVIRRTVEWLKMWNYPSKVLVGSVRGPFEIQEAALAGAHIITIPPALLAKFVDHKYSRATVRQFNEDARKALAEGKKLKKASSR